MIILVPRELEIMELLWDEGQALTRDEIIRRSPNRFRKSKKICLLLDSLLKKGAVKNRQDGTFVAAISPEEHLAQMRENQGCASKIVLTAAGISEPMDLKHLPSKEELAELREILDQKIRDIEQAPGPHE